MKLRRILFSFIKMRLKPPGGLGFRVPALVLLGSAPGPQLHQLFLLTFYTYCWWWICDGSVTSASAMKKVGYRKRACTQVLFLQKAELGLFHFFRNSDSLAGTFRWSEDSSWAWVVPSTAEDPTCWKQVSSCRQWSWKYKGKIKSRQCFTYCKRPGYDFSPKTKLGQ